MVILVTGGTGKTSTRLARLLHNDQKMFIIASRRGPAAAPADMEAVKFDWSDESTFENPFEHKFKHHKPITAIYLVAPEGDVGPMIKFFDLAHGKYGVKRFVMLAGLSAKKGDPHDGRAWQHMADAGAELTMIRASWFMEQFSEQQYLHSIKSEGKFYTACGDGKAGFIAANDIAAMAFALLTSPEYKHSDLTAVGRESLTHDEVAAIFSRVLDRKTEHVKITPEEKTRRLMQEGVPEDGAKFLAYLDGITANGFVGAASDEGHQHVAELIGRPQQTFEEFVQENKAVWE